MIIHESKISISSIHHPQVPIDGLDGERYSDANEKGHQPTWADGIHRGATSSTRTVSRDTELPDTLMNLRGIQPYSR